MNWDAIGAVGEIIGAVVVIVTLLYVAKQIRQTSKSLEMAALRDTTAQWNQWSELLVTTPDLAAIVARGNKSHDSLSAEEALRYGAYIQSFFDCVESNHNLICRHDVEKDLHVLEAIVRRRIALSGYYDWWQANTEDYDDQFVAWVEGICRSGENEGEKDEE